MPNETLRFLEPKMSEYRVIYNGQYYFPKETDSFFQELIKPFASVMKYFKNPFVLTEDMAGIFEKHGVTHPIIKNKIIRYLRH